MTLREQLAEVEAIIAAVGLDVVKDHVGVGLGESVTLSTYQPRREVREALAEFLGAPKRDTESSLRCAIWDRTMSCPVRVRAYFWYPVDAKCDACGR